MRITIITLLVLAFGPALCQQTADSIAQKPLRYFFNINSGMLTCKTCAVEGKVIAAASTIHGVELNEKWRFGAGVGFRGYGQVTAVPLFGSVSYNMFGKKHKSGMFVEFNYGAAKAWSNWINGYGQVADVKAYHFVQPSIGYALRYHQLRAAFQLGFESIKTVRVYNYNSGPIEYSYNNFRYVMPPPKTEIINTINRFFMSISIGI